MASTVWDPRRMPPWCGAPQRILVSRTDSSKLIFSQAAVGSEPAGYKTWNQTNPSTCTAIAFFLGGALIWDGGNPAEIDISYVRDRMYEGMQKYADYFESDQIPVEIRQSALLHSVQLVDAYKTRSGRGQPLQPKWSVLKEVRGIAIAPGYPFPNDPRLEFFNPKNDIDETDNKGRIMRLRQAIEYIDQLCLEERRSLFANIAMNGHTVGVASHFVTETLSYFYAYDSAPGRFLMTVSAAHLSSVVAAWLGEYRPDEIPRAVEPGLEFSRRGQFDVVIIGLFDASAERSESILTRSVGEPIEQPTELTVATAEPLPAELRPPIENVESTMQIDHKPIPVPVPATPTKDEHSATKPATRPRSGSKSSKSRDSTSAPKTAQ